MKNIILILFIFISTTLLAQSNPDGDKVSLHITPFINMSDLNIADEDFFSQTYNLNLKVKIPIKNKITISPFYQIETFRSTILKENNIFNTNKNENQFELTNQRIGATLSIYFN